MKRMIILGSLMVLLGVFQQVGAVEIVCKEKESGGWTCWAGFDPGVCYLSPHTYTLTDVISDQINPSTNLKWTLGDYVKKYGANDGCGLLGWQKCCKDGTTDDNGLYCWC